MPYSVAMNSVTRTELKVVLAASYDGCPKVTVVYKSVMPNVLAVLVAILVRICIDSVYFSFQNDSAVFCSIWP